MRTRVLAGAAFAVFVAVSTWGFAQSPNNPRGPSGNSIPRPQSGIPRPKTTIPQPDYTYTPPPRTRSLLDDYKPSTAHLEPKSKKPKSHISTSSIKGLFILIGGVVGVIGWVCRKVMG